MTRITVRAYSRVMSMFDTPTHRETKMCEWTTATEFEETKNQSTTVKSEVRGPRQPKLCSTI